MARKKISEETSKFPKSVFTALAVIVFVSGLCSLAYQVVWLREFRLIFGGAAPAASAVLAVFMGGLGLGGLYLGKRVEASAYPGRIYAWIEAGITLATLLSPLLMALIGKAYILTGGVQTLGLPLATLLQILMTVIVIGPACFMMGGTLPAVLRVAQSDEDDKRMTTALFYGVNVAGAVTGAFLATFVWLQSFGNLRTLLLACAANAVIAAGAYILLRDRKREPEVMVEKVEKKKTKANAEETSPARPRWFFPGAAFVSGFAFFLIELVWYRASIPLFGGSVYNFGLILAVALAGIGCGSLLYSLVLRRVEPSLGLFALISGMLALCIIVPFAMGDRLAHATLLLNNYFMPRSFDGLVFGWTCICVVLVFPPAFFSGIQFPLLISLIGEGGRNIGAQLGRVYAWNTLGAVTGALMGGFILIPYLSITGSWRVAALMAITLSCAALFLHKKSKRGKKVVGGTQAARLAVGLCLLTLLISFGAAGPSAYWLHHPIGYGRANAMYGASETDWINYVNSVNRSLIASKDGRETSVAVTSNTEYAMLSNGKSDSSAIIDSSTTVMSGLAGVILHPGEVKTACVVGYGTGITAGWMSKVESINQLDIIELESAIVDLGRYFSAANFDVAESPKVRLLEGDAREILITRPQQYDLITSEPSNLHRAGVANLYTKEFYESVSSRLNADGLFCQWVQTYETDMESVNLVIATLSSVFPKVELWQAGAGDMLLICSRENKPWQVATLRGRLKEEPFATGIRNLWGTTTLEGFFSRAVANADFTKRIAEGSKRLNTDDLNYLEFWFAHNLGLRSEPLLKRLMQEADARGELIPDYVPDDIPFDREQWAGEFVWKGVCFDEEHMLPRPPAGANGWSEEVMDQVKFIGELRKLSPKEQAANWPVPVMTEFSRLMWLSALANTSDPRFVEEIPALRETWPLEYHVLRAEYLASMDKPKEAMLEYFAAVRLAKTHPLIRHGYPVVIWQGIENMVKKVEFTSREELIACFEATAGTVSYAGMTDGQRRILISLSMPLELKYQVRAAEAWGHHPQWNEQVLGFRRDVFKKANHPDAARAERDWEKWSKSTRRGVLKETTEPTDK